MFRKVVTVLPRWDDRDDDKDKKWRSKRDDTVLKLKLIEDWLVADDYENTE
jgi:hypothetical protein